MRAVGNVVAAMMACTATAAAVELTNGEFTLTLRNGPNGSPCILSAKWADGDAFQSILKSKPGIAGAWEVDETPAFHRARFRYPFEGRIEMTQVVELAKSGSLFQVYHRAENHSGTPQAMETYPVYQGEWALPDAPVGMTWWKALSFQPQEASLAGGREVLLRSRLHSSDTIEPGGFNPYWLFESGDTRLYCGLAWCGGWQANIKGTDKGAALNVFLPPDETQLTLADGEGINGPVLMVTATREPGLRESRANWMRQRAALARVLYGGPEPGYHFTYNHWYTTRFDVDGDFLSRQVDLMDPYDFDFFIVDAGWYKNCGDWTPDTKKFKEGEFEAIIHRSIDKGVPVGIWTCPQFMKADQNNLPPEVDQPGFYRKFIDGHLIDMAGTDFTSFLLDHVKLLRERYGATWWKYDQDFFTPETRHGVMKNVVALQDALLAVRKANPSLYVENCQSGGRMLNEFSVLSTQSQWIRDGGSTGMGHARGILRDALGAIQFLPPWTCNRWTNNPGRNDPEDDEFTRFYMRCAMAGAWGIVADLGNIENRQRSVIVRQAALYRAFSTLKNDYLYDIYYPGTRPYAGVTYYSADGRRAASLLCRWVPSGDIDERVPLPGLKSETTYVVQDADSGARRKMNGADLRDKGLPLPMREGTLSKVFFIKAAE